MTSVFEEQEFGQFINILLVEGIKVFSPSGTVYSGKKYAVRTLSRFVDVDINEIVLRPAA